MIEFTKEIDELKKAIVNSDLYERYQNAKHELKNYPSKDSRVQEFRLKNYNLHNTKEEIDLFYEMDQLAKEYADLYKDPLTLEYLSAEVAVCRVYQQINRELIECLEFEGVLL